MGLSKLMQSVLIAPVTTSNLMAQHVNVRLTATYGRRQPSKPFAPSTPMQDKNELAWRYDRLSADSSTCVLSPPSMILNSDSGQTFQRRASMCKPKSRLIKGDTSCPSLLHKRPIVTSAARINVQAKVPFDQGRHVMSLSSPQEADHNNAKTTEKPAAMHSILVLIRGFWPTPTTKSRCWSCGVPDGSVHKTAPYGISSRTSLVRESDPSRCSPARYRNSDGSAIGAFNTISAKNGPSASVVVEKFTTVSPSISLAKFCNHEARILSGFGPNENTGSNSPSLLRDFHDRETW
eukprot:CAMPEP_0198370848 /NCGR_PEP_ID=MMETSP1450-20131203/156924_1 /TAXON_ID=753684 ORGANISM="Madagascaria erythrocladiodes, Strain CCMP3234" /NCGR_SAMPLE_ID=MMETSP1450 /ASSEMBLY_ACC=CAM_ASM_001115 /LENGTH=291 /DNA_ID=CAMNT_0044078397 /DNA_START=1401 /DNA_END=2277 /DNA_ORIENTATION=+